LSHDDNNKGWILDRGNVGNEDSMIIKYVLYVQGLKHNLLSINQLCDKGYQVIFEPYSCMICEGTSRYVLLVGKRVNNVYKLYITNIESKIECLLSRTKEYWLWHRRISHIHMHHLNKLISKDLVVGIPKLKFEKDKVCETC